MNKIKIMNKNQYLLPITKWNIQHVYLMFVFNALEQRGGRLTAQLMKLRGLVKYNLFQALIPSLYYFSLRGPHPKLYKLQDLHNLDSPLGIWL